MPTKNPKYKNVHSSVLALPDDNELSRVSVKGWIKHQKELLKAEMYNFRRGLGKNTLAKIGSIRGYISQLEYYLANGDYVADFWGEKENNPTSKQCIAMAYDKDGMPKRTVGVYYPDMGAVWTKEMENDSRRF